MRNVRLMAAFAVASAFFLLSTSAHAENSATVNVDARVVTPLVLTKNTDLNFGSFAASGVAGTVVLDLANSRTATGGVTALAIGATPSSANFSVAGEANSTVSINIPANVSLSNGAATMTLVPSTNSPAQVTLNGSGSATFAVGGTLSVSANQASGNYTGTFNVSVTYQ